MSDTRLTQRVNVGAITTGAGTAIAANGERLGWSIQNLGQNPLFVNLGGTASTTVFHFVLKGGTANDDGLGGVVGQTNGTVFTGIITVAGTNPRFAVLEH